MAAWHAASVLRSFDHRDFPAETLVSAKGQRRVSVCLPAQDEEATVGQMVEIIRAQLMQRHRLVDELVVIDDGSTDRTAEVARGAGADVYPADGLLPEHPGAGKGQAMWKGVNVTTGDLVVFCDADIRDFEPHFVTGLLGPLLMVDGINFVKGCYQRPLDGRAGEGGRVTELVARPLISLLFPHLAGMVQPLAGECAARREVLEQVPFVDGYGVDLGLLIDVARRDGIGAMAQCDLGRRVHRNRPLAELGPQAMAIVQLALSRAGLAPDVGLPWGALLRPGVEPLLVPLSERPPLAELAARRKTA
ncbi:MAG: glucosyl-3-phosphoglycerate synthase [Actinomycetota bacterium]|nr:glucosyl-3-phosphoglycerate synthase [Actinomycetota bacterium]